MNMDIFPIEQREELLLNGLFGVLLADSELLRARIHPILPLGLSQADALATVITSRRHALGKPLTATLLDGADEWLERHSEADALMWLGDGSGADADALM